MARARKRSKELARSRENGCCCCYVFVRSGGEARCGSAPRLHTHTHSHSHLHTRTFNTPTAKETTGQRRAWATGNTLQCLIRCGGSGGAERTPGATFPMYLINYFLQHAKKRSMPGRPSSGAFARSPALAASRGGPRRHAPVFSPRSIPGVPSVSVLAPSPCVPCAGGRNDGRIATGIGRAMMSAKKKESFLCFRTGPAVVQLMKRRVGFGKAAPSLGLSRSRGSVNGRSMANSVAPGARSVPSFGVS